jgi:histidinol-phosphatase (PHP family)
VDQPTPALPADNHVHTEWSWDAALGSMERSCARAIEIGLPAVAFTEHLDHTSWAIGLDIIPADHFLATLVAPDGSLTPPAFDATGYLAAIEDCRERFPSLRILSGLEIGEPHWHAAAVAKVLGAGQFDRVLGSQHCLPVGDGFNEPPSLYARNPAAAVVRQYLAEVACLIAESDVFSVLAHIDYPIRYWPQDTAGPFDLYAFQDEFRHALRALADSGRALEFNTKLPMDPVILRWWREEGGSAVTFASDAHEPLTLARGFADAAAVVEATGFRPGRHPYDPWRR